MEQNEKHENLIKVYGKENIQNLLDEFHINDETSNILNFKSLTEDFKTFEELKLFIEYLNVSNYLNKKLNGSEYQLLKKQFHFYKAENKDKANQIEQYEGKEVEEKEVKNVELKFPEHFEKDIELIKEGVQALEQDQSDVKLFDKISGVEDMLNKQISTKTEKKATFEQVESIAKQNTDISAQSNKIADSLKKVEEILPSNIEKYYTSKDLSKYFVYGVSLSVSLLILVVVAIALLYKFLI